MQHLKRKLKNKETSQPKFRDIIRNENGAIDLASIMVGIIVIGLIGGVIAATVFAVIPWTQDNAAKQQLDSIVSAQNAYRGLTSALPSPLPSTHEANSYGNSASLASAFLLVEGSTYCTVTTDGGKGYTAYSKSSSGKIWATTDKNTKPAEYTGSLPSDCSFLGNSGPSQPAYVDPAPGLTTLTYKCNFDTTGVLPMRGNLVGTETWSDGVTATYSEPANTAAKTTARKLLAGVEYKVTFDGTYTAFRGEVTGGFTHCLTAVNHWGEETGVTNATLAFGNASKLTDVPANIPSTITNMNSMFEKAPLINDPDISKWNVSNVTTMRAMFFDAKLFNQPLNDWNVSKVTDLYYMFFWAEKFNQPLDKWNTASVTNMSYTFRGAYAFNQPLNSWNTSNVTEMSATFLGATSFNQPLDKWDTSKVDNMRAMFQSARVFNQNIDGWNVANVTTLEDTFNDARAFNQPLNSWNTSKVGSLRETFLGATSFNQSLNNWNTSGVADMWDTFNGATNFNGDITTWNTGNSVGMKGMLLGTAFNYDISHWNTVKVVNGTSFVSSSFPDAYMPANTSK